MIRINLDDWCQRQIQSGGDFYTVAEWKRYVAANNYDVSKDSKGVEHIELSIEEARDYVTGNRELNQFNS